MDYKEEIQCLVEQIKKEGFESVCFWLPAYNVGGGTYYLCKLAQYLVKNSDLKIYYMDYPNGYPCNLLSDSPDIKIVYYDEKNPTFPIKEKCVIITNSTRVIQIPNMRKDNKLLFWHYETIPCAWDIVLIDNETKKYLDLAKKTNAMVYHDWSARNSLSQYKHSNFKNKDYLHLYTTPKTIVANENNISGEAINLCFLSRLAPDKKESLYYLIENYAKYKTTKKKRLHVIGDGRSSEEVHNFCKKYEKEIEFIFTGTIQRENLDEYLVNNVDIVFGVGTCVLEAAALKLPAAAMIMSGKKLHEEVVYWAYDTIEYCMGILDTQKKDFKIKYTKISDAIDAVYNNEGGKRIEGDKCYQYFMNNHSDYDYIVYKFLTFIKNSTLTHKKLRKCIKFTPYITVSMEKFWSKKFPIFKKIIHNNITKYYLFNIPVIKKVVENNKNKYYICGINLGYSKKQVPFKFPTAQFTDGKKG
ncbi:glycosyltransferase [bacterium]|nr:glycosyltransferase [bacterium]